MDKKVSQQTLADLLGVSQRAVSKALKGEKDVSPKLCKKVKELADQLGYRPNRLARTLREGKSRIIGVLVPRALGYYFMKIWEVIEDQIIANGYTPLIVRAGYSPENDDRILKMFLDYQVDGMIVVPPIVDWRKDFFQDYMQKGGNIVFIGDMTIRGAFRVFCDDVNGIVDAMKHLKELGHEKIAFLTHPKTDNHAMCMRYEGFEKGKKPIDFKAAELCVVEEYDLAVFKDFIKNNPDISAVICSSDKLALIACDTCYEMGLKVPEDFSIIGFANNLLLPEHAKVPPTTVAHDPETVASIAVETLFKKISGEKATGKIAVPNRIIVRKSTAKHS